MGTPVGGGLACENITTRRDHRQTKSLEFGPFEDITPNNSHYFRYIDDILHIYSQEFTLIKITDRLNLGK